MNRGLIVLLLLFVAVASKAVDSLSLDLGKVTGKGWQLEGARIIVGGIKNQFLNLELTIDRLVLPKPYDYISLLNMQCSSFIIEAQKVSCNKGTAELESPWLEAAKMPFSLHISDEHSEFIIDNIKIAGGTASIRAEQRHDQWHFDFQARQLQSTQLFNLFKVAEIEVSGGSLHIQAQGRGTGTGLQHLTLDVALHEMTAQTTDLEYACEALTAEMKTTAMKQKGSWEWDSQIAIQQGGVYADPVYIMAEDKTQQPISLNMGGSWQERQNRYDVKTVLYNHPGIVAFKASGLLYDSEYVGLQHGFFSIQTENLKSFTPVYLTPFFTATVLDGISLAGKANAEFTYSKQAMTELQADFSRLTVTDAASRLNISDAAGHIQWTADRSNNSHSDISWGQLGVFGLSVGPAKLSFTTDAGSIRLLQPGKLPFYGGIININNFTWVARMEQEPDVHFKGSLEHISLEQLSSALDWTPLSGIVSGEIPGVTYAQGELSLDGELNVKLFDGEIQIKKLVSSGLFSEFPRLESEVEILDLDLKQLTNKFSFGYIEGKLSGYIHGLHLENWQPVSFYAWLGTPEDDDSRHRISQKAVQNIANIGGGGAADILSRSFLRFFETFHYNRLGMGCYLHNGVCQLMGVKVTEQGYYIVEGGGLPRIDVIGYNPRVDWKVLLNRLERITSTENVVVE